VQHHEDSYKGIDLEVSAGQNNYIGVQIGAENRLLSIYFNCFTRLLVVPFISITTNIAVPNLRILRKQIAAVLQDVFIYDTDFKLAT
jgi:hypothetical protein